MGRNRGEKARKKTALRHHTPTDAEKEAMREAAINGPPMVTAIMGALWIEAGLDEILKFSFSIKDESIWQSLVGDNGPLSTFNQKIIAAYAFGAYDSLFMKNLQNVKKIRNIFAHTSKVIDFDDESIVNEMNKITEWLGIDNDRKEIIREIRSKQHSNRDCYLVLCAVIDTCILESYVRKFEKHVTAVQRDLIALRLEQANQRAIYYLTNPLIFQANALVSSEETETGDPTP